MIKNKKPNPEKRKLLYIILIFLGFEFAYQLLRYCEEMYFPSVPFVIMIPMTALGVLIIVYMIMTRGFASKPFTAEELDPALDISQRQALAELYNARREKAKKLTYFIVPLALLVSLDLLNMFLIDPLVQSMAGQ